MTEQHGKEARPPPLDLVDREEEWEIEAIVAHKKMQCGIKYLVKRKGFPSSVFCTAFMATIRGTMMVLQ